MGPSFRFSGRETSRRNPGARFQGHEATNSGVWNEYFPAAGVAYEIPVFLRLFFRPFFVSTSRCRQRPVRWLLLLSCRKHKSRRWMNTLCLMSRYPHPVSYTHLDVYKRQDLTGVQFVNGTRPGNPQLVELAKRQVGNVGDVYKRQLAYKADNRKKNNEKGGQPESCSRKPGGRLFRLLYAYET